MYIGTGGGGLGKEEERKGRKKGEKRGGNKGLTLILQYRKKG